MKLHFQFFRSDSSHIPSQPTFDKLAKCYLRAKYKALKQYTGENKDDHRHLLKDLFGQLGDCVPFPNHIVANNDRYRCEIESIDMSPHAFETAKLIDRLCWMTRLVLCKGGSESKRVENFSTRGLSGRKIQLARSADRDLSLSTAVMQAGSCTDNAAFVKSLMHSVDAEMLDHMGIHLDMAKLSCAIVWDDECDHAYAIVHDGESPIRLQEGLDPYTGRSGARLADSIDTTHIWSMDPHQLYPMASRYDRSLYNHLEHGFLRPPGSHCTDLSVMDLGLASAIRRTMTDKLKLGEQGIDKALQHDLMRNKKIRSRFVDHIVRTKGAKHYAAVDTSSLNPADSRKFEAKVQKLEREVTRKRLKQEYKSGRMEERWRGLCLPENPGIAYRNSETGEVLTPSVPVTYLERTERMRWAYDVWKATRPARNDLNRKFFGAKFHIHPAVEAIENMPFLSALAGARALNLSSNVSHQSRIAEYENALVALEEWVTRMHDTYSQEPDVVNKIVSVKLDAEVARSLKQVRDNLLHLAKMIARLDEDTQISEEDKARNGKLRYRALSSPAFGKLQELRAAFKRDN